MRVDDKKMLSKKIMNQNTNFHGNGLPVLFGSLPLRDHGEAIELVFRHTPEIPGWVQLPAKRQEGMMVQFMADFPGFHIENETVYVDTDWSIVLESSADIVSFDAYSYFDRFMLYPDEIRDFIKAGGIIAWGIVPTMKTEDIERETAASLAKQWEKKAEKIKEIGIDGEI